MKTILFSILPFLFCISSMGSESKNITAKFQDLNKPYNVKIEIQNNQVLFAKPNATMEFDLGNITEYIIALEANKPYTYVKKDQAINITLPAENKMVEINFQLKNNTKIKCTILTAIIDKDTSDGEVKFNEIAYPIGKYPSIPNKGKTNYFKEKYEPPQYFFIWNSLLEEFPISKSLKYADLVIKPDAEKPDQPRPERATKIFTLSYETILNFDLIIEKARLKTPFKKITVLSYYRTPEYNNKIGAAAFSRHIYGDGIDWFIDENKEDGVMDDLNKDGLVNEEDGLSFVQAIIEMVNNHEIEPCGTGVYFTKKGASLHYDSRGHLARWGASEQWWPDKSLPDWLLDIENKVKEADKK